MTKVTIDRELQPCPFCGSPAKSDNGFAPAESITYAWCSNTECQLHSVDVGMTPADWNQRALPKVDPQPPAVSVTWHESPESVRRAMWEEVAVAEGMTYEQLIAESVGCGETEDGDLVEFSYEQELAGMREQGCWAFVDARTNTIHAWADDATPRELVLHMLAHEIGHITGESHPDDIQEEMRAEQFGRVAKMAYALLPALAAPRQPEGDGLEVVAWQDADNPLYTTAERRQMHRWATDGYPVVELCRLSDAQRAIAELREECERLRKAPCECGAPVGFVSGEKYHAEHERLRDCRAERDTLRQQLAERDATIERLRVKLMTIASAEPRRHTIEWAKAMAATGNNESYAKWREAFDRRDKLAGLLIRARGCIDAMGWDELETEIDAALAEVKPCPESPHPAAT